MSKPTALITGASSGIGQELAREFARHGHGLVLTARREDRLEALAEELRGKVPVCVIPADLGRRKGARRLLADLDDREIEVGVLVNNAGVAASGPFQSMDGRTARNLMQVNMASLVELTQGVLPAMLARGRGRILNVASVAGFQAVPGIALYSATKAFVLSFSESLAEDLKGTGVTVTALCPGPTRTDMIADIEPLELAGPFMTSAREVAQDGYRASLAGEVVRIPGLANQAMVTWLQYQPRGLVRWFSGMAARSTFGAKRPGAVPGRTTQDGRQEGS